MKGVSAVIATILMLMITIAMAGVAYMYISGIFTAKTGVVIEIDESATSCGAANAITVWVRNTGTIKTDTGTVKLSGTRSDGVSITQVACGGTTALNAGGSSVACTATLTGTQGNNRIVVSGSSNTITGTVYCSG